MPITYNLYRDGVLVAKNLTGTSVSVTDEPASSQAYWSVTAVSDAEGSVESKPSIAHKVNLSAWRDNSVPPSAPVVIEAVSSERGNLYLEFDFDAGAGADPTSFNIYYAAADVSDGGKIVSSGYGDATTPWPDTPNATAGKING